MKPRSVVKGTDRYIVGQIERFDQKEEIFKRSTWDSSLLELAKKYYARFDGQAMPQDRDGYTLKEMALSMAGWHIALDFGSGQFVGGEGTEAWEAWQVGRTDTTRVPKGVPANISGPEEATRLVKRAARLYGASLVGTCILDRRWLYSHSYHTLKKEHKPIDIPREYNYAIVMAHEMDYDAIERAPSFIADAAASAIYSKMPITGAMLAQYIRGLGYKAIPMINDTANSVPLAIDAGLGELSRMGVLMTPEYGPRVRLHKVFTDMPLIPDEPVEFGVWDFCLKCQQCAKYCPGQAIPRMPPTAKINDSYNREGLLRWPLKAENCFSFMARSDTDCGVCIRVCPFNKPPAKLHDMVRWGVRRAPWLNSGFLQGDKWMGHWKRAAPAYFWE
ncbi:reductive dehalogenase [Chloroflexota bacterium]